MNISIHSDFISDIFVRYSFIHFKLQLSTSTVKLVYTGTVVLCQLDHGAILHYYLYIGP